MPKAISKAFSRDSCDVSPVGNTHRATLISDHSCSATVTGLLFGKRPFAISRLIITVSFYAIQGAVWGSMTHIGKECFKRNAPLRTDRNTSTSIPFPTIGSDCMATFEHGLPGLISPRPVQSVLFVRGSSGLGKVCGSHDASPGCGVVRGPVDVGASLGLAILTL